MYKQDNDSSSSTTTTTNKTTTTRNWINKKWILVNHPDGHFCAKRDAKLIVEEMKCIDDFLTSSTLEADEVVVQVEALSVDAFLRTMLDKSTAYNGNTVPGSTLPALGYGIVVCTGPSKSATKFKRGARVMGLLGACTMATVKASALFPIVSLPFVPTSLSLGYLGTSGLTAYAGMFLALPGGGRGRSYPKRGETVVVSAAAGAVGSIAAQMAKCCGARVIGIAGGARKVHFLRQDLGLHGAIDYKDTTRSLQEQIDEQCPNGVDFYFDNVGGEMLNVVLNNINNFSRIVICGAISQYGDGSINNRENNKNGVVGPSNYIKLAEKSSIMTGFNLMHFGSKIFMAIPYLLWHYFRGNIKVHEHVEDGIEAFPVALEKMFNGTEVGDGHCGRLLIDVNGSLRRS